MSAQPIREVVAAPNTITIQGLISEVRRHEADHYTTVILPAADAYSRPQTVEIRSRRSLGSVRSEVTVGCRVGGWARKFEYADKNTGVIERGSSVRVTLDALED